MALGCVMLTCTIRWTPARRAAWNRALELETATSWSIAPWAKRTQYVL